MSEVKLILEMSKALERMLDKAAQNEKNFCYDVQLEFERYSWDVLRMRHGIESIVDTFGG